MQKCTNIEGLVRRFFRVVFPTEEVLYNHRPDWLRYISGHNLELDIYFPQLKLAVEVQGFQHKVLDAQKRRDEFKKYKCQAAGVVLLCVSHPAQLLRGYHIGQIGRFIDVRDGMQIPYSLQQKMKNYKPQKTKFGAIVKLKVRRQSYWKLQEAETALNRAKMLRKGLL